MFFYKKDNNNFEVWILALYIHAILLDDLCIWASRCGKSY